MKPVYKRVLVVLVVFIVAIQFLPLHRNTFPHINTIELHRVYAVPENVQTILKNACYDCHSDNTAYPWYSHIQPVGWWLNDHVKEGKRRLNFTGFGNYSSTRKVKKLNEIAETVGEKEMPLSSYLLMHEEAKLSNADRELIKQWALSLAQQIADTAAHKQALNSK